LEKTFKDDSSGVKNQYTIARACW